MKEINGKYNTAKSFAKHLDSETIEQVKNLCDQEFTKNSTIAIMPDAHFGIGCTVGTAMTIRDKIVPNLVGVDLSCSMLAIKIAQKEVDFEKLDKVIKKYIPSGHEVHIKPIAGINLSGIKAPKDNERAQKSLGTLGGGNHFISL